MTNVERRRPWVTIAGTTLLLALAILAPRADAQPCSLPTCVSVTLNVNVQLTNLHPSVSTFVIECSGRNRVGPRPIPSSANSPFIPVVNRGYSGNVPLILRVAADVLANPANRTFPGHCELFLRKGNETKAAVASAAQPVVSTATNWEVVASGSKVSWSQPIVIPNATP